jgi:2-keto-4-pentenoate hydratase/2-oxohepta-3-ene-1,7-dioic acid hydratase in catechol pathway
VAGYTCGLDISNRDVQFGPLKNISAAKSFDTSKPFGPIVDTAADAQSLEVILRQNGVVRQQASTSKMIFPVSRLISEISRCMTLLPGDVIFSGTPSGVGPVAPGDDLEVEIPGLGCLKVNVQASAEAG